jgi:pSer/pThr/pTyr-binding forkhead associated (FHA) protein
VISQKSDFTNQSDSEVASSLVKGRSTNGLPVGRFSLSFAGGYCTGRTAFMVTKDKISIGRGEECDIVLEGETVSRVHCQIIHSGADFLIQDGSRNGTFVNGRRISDSELSDGDQIRIGNNILIVHISSGFNTNWTSGKMTASFRSDPDLDKLKPQIIVKGLEQGVTQLFSEDLLIIGRRSDNHIVLDADNISRQHLSIERRELGYFVCDLSSSNGTYLNDDRIDSSHLKDGDRLRIGNYLLTVSLIDQDCILNFKKINR